MHLLMMLSAEMSNNFINCINASIDSIEREVVSIIGNDIMCKLGAR